MSESFYDELEGLIGKHREKEAIEKREQENEARFQRLEAGIGKIGETIEARLPENSPAADTSESSAGNKGEDESNASDKTPPPEPVEDEPEMERITNFTVPRIYKGDDEPDMVKYIDADTGEEKTRKGRKRNRPVSYDVEKVADSDTEEAPGIPTEPSEESA